MNESKKWHEWMSKFGYSLHSFNGSETVCNYLNMDQPGEGYPMVSIDSRGVSFVGDGPKLFIQLKVGPISFGHPDMERYIEVMRHYTKVCEQNPPLPRKPKDV